MKVSFEFQVKPSNWSSYEDKFSWQSCSNVRCSSSYSAKLHPHSSAPSSYAPFPLRQLATPPDISTPPFSVYPTCIASLSSTALSSVLIPFTSASVPLPPPFLLILFLLPLPYFELTSIFRTWAASVLVLALGHILIWFPDPFCSVDRILPAPPVPTRAVSLHGLWPSTIRQYTQSIEQSPEVSPVHIQVGQCRFRTIPT